METIEQSAGDDIHDNFDQALEIVRRNKDSVSFNHNGLTVIIVNRNICID